MLSEEVTQVEFININTEIWSSEIGEWIEKVVEKSRCKLAKDITTLFIVFALKQLLTTALSEEVIQVEFSWTL